MSPEQAAGRLDQLGPATDVYSLGATLYCLLTGRVPFDRGEGDILQRVQRGLFAPPRQVKREVPAALEAVCLKAMALRPQERYSGARELARDVESWLADEPVSAYREPLRLRLGRWMRRNRTLVTSTAVLLVTAVAALTAGLVLLGLEQARTEQQRKLAVTERERADENARSASEQRGLALQTLKDVIFDFQRGLKNRPGMHDLRKKLLDRARQGLDKVARSAETSRQVDRNRAVICNEMGDIFLLLGDTARARQQYQEGHRIAQALAQADPTDAQAQSDLSISFDKVGNVQLRLGDSKGALESYRKGLTIRQALAQADPKDARAQLDLSVSYNKLGDVQLRLGDSKAALEAYHKYPEVAQALAQADPRDAQAQRDLFVSYTRLGGVQLRLGDTKAALESHRKCLDIAQVLAQADPGNAEARSDLCYSLNSLAWLLATCPEPQLRDTAQAVTLAQKLVALAPQIGDGYNTLGVCYYRAGNWKTAVATLEKAIQLNKAGTSSDWFFLAMAHHQLGHKEQARSFYDRAVQWMDKNQPTTWSCGAFALRPPPSWESTRSQKPTIAARTNNALLWPDQSVGTAGSAVPAPRRGCPRLGRRQAGRPSLRKRRQAGRPSLRKRRQAGRPSLRKRRQAGRPSLRKDGRQPCPFGCRCSPGRRPRRWLCCPCEERGPGLLRSGV
jgi:tetratricopeptide (TPR) repeat protein